MEARRELLVNRDLMYALTEDRPGQLFLEVLCGGFAMENVILPLSQEERDAYAKVGKEVLDDLARRVAKERRRFSDRIIE